MPTRRELLAGTPRLLLGGRPAVHAEPKWNELVGWTNAWDATDAVTYVPTSADQTNYGITNAARVSTIPNRGTDTYPLRRDTGAYSAAFGLPSFLPGPLYTPTSSFFKGRPALQFDGPLTGGLHSMLSPVTDFANSATWFNPPNGYTPPYWCAFLGDGLDATLGSQGTGPTIAAYNILGGTPKPWQVACWNTPAFPITTITAQHVRDDTESVFVIYYNSGAGPTVPTSFLELNYRWRNGQLQTVRKYGPQDNWQYKEMFLGWTDEHRYWSALGIKTGTPTEADLTKVRSWGVRYLPVQGSGA